MTATAAPAATVGSGGVPLLRRLLLDRRRSMLWWSVSMALLVALVAVSYSTVEGQTELEESFEDLPDSVRVLLGVEGELSLISPEGYLNSQLFANFLPIVLTVFAIGVGARIVAGDEGDGFLELVFAHPLARRRLALERVGGAILLLAGLGVVCALALLATAPAANLDIGVGPLTAATATSVLLALVHMAVTFGVGAWTGSRAAAIAAGAGLTAGGFLLQSLAQLADPLRFLRWLSPWQWFLDRPAVVDGWPAVALPGLGVVAVSTLAVGLGTLRFERRDLQHR